MTFFEQELQRIFGKGMGLSNVRIVANAYYGRLSEDVRVKIHFTYRHSPYKYDALKVTLINRCEGPIDSMVLHFSDLWGIRRVANPNFPDGVCPHIWDNNGKMKWYVFKPTGSDYNQLSWAVSDYLDVFREPVQEPQMEQKMC